MKDPVHRMPWPFEGVNENWGFEDQPLASSRDALNVRSQDPTNRRMRGAQRPALEKFVTGAVNGADVKIQDLGAIARNRLHVDYTARTATEDVTIEAETILGSVDLGELNHQARDIAIDDQGNVIVLHGTVRLPAVVTEGVWPGQMISVLSSDLSLIQEITIPFTSEAQGAVCMAVDPFGCIYVGAAEDEQVNTDISGARIFKWTREPDASDAGFRYELAWSIPSGFTAGTPDEIPDEGFGGDLRVWSVFYHEADDVLYSVQTDGGSYPGTGATTGHVIAYTNLGAVRPAMEIRFELLDDSSKVQKAPRVVVVRNDGDIFVAHRLNGTDADATLQEPRISMWRRSGMFVDQLEKSECGMGLILLSDNATLITVGEGDSAFTFMGVSAFDAGTEGLTNARPILSFNQNHRPDVQFPESFGTFARAVNFLRMAEDSFGKVYVPYLVNATSFGSPTDPTLSSTLYIFTAPFTDHGSPGGGVTYAEKSADLLFEYVGDGSDGSGSGRDDSPGALCVAVPPRAPDYDGDLTGDDERAEFVYLGITTDGAGVGALGPPHGTYKALRKIRMIEADHEPGGPRETRYLAVAAGELKMLDPVGDTIGAPTIDDDPLNPLDGQGNPTVTVAAEYVESVNLLSKRYFTDGMHYGVYDPFTDGWTKLEATRGELPRMCRLVSAYRNRLIFARSAGGDGPHLWFMSRIGNPTDWDEDPVAESIADAISGNNLSGPLTCPDIITSLIPFDNDHLFFGCDRSIYLLRGDPRQGGALDNVTTEVGVAFGRPWTRDRNGRLWLVDSEGGLAILGNNGLERVSLDKLEARLRNVDQSTHYYRLAWDNEQEGIHILVLPFGSAGSTDTEHWFFSTRTGAFWPMKFGVSSPTAVVAFESDAPDDRTVAMGFSDGLVRRWNSTATADDGTNVDSYVTYGPWNPRDTGQEWRLQSLNVVLARDQGGCNYELFGVADMDEPLELPMSSGTLLPGRNRVSVSAQAAFIYLRLRDSGPTRWAVEDVYWESVMPVGRIAK